MTHKIKASSIIFVLSSLLCVAVASQDKGNFLVNDTFTHSTEGGWNLYKQKYDLNFWPGEEEMHKSSYNDNVDFIKGINSLYKAKNVTWYAGVNKYSHIPRKTFLSRNTLRMNTTLNAGRAYKDNVIPRVKKASEVPQKYLTPIRDDLMVTFTFLCIWIRIVWFMLTK